MIGTEGGEYGDVDENKAHIYAAADGDFDIEFN